MATNGNISKVKVENAYYQIKDTVARENKIDKLNPSGTGYIELNKGDKAPGENSISLGYKNNATGLAAAGVGAYNEAAGDYSQVNGYNNKSNSNYQFILGKYNEILRDDVVEVGWGDNDAQRANLFRIKNNGDVYVKKDIYLGSTRDIEEPMSLVNKLNYLETQIHNNEYTLPAATSETLGGVKIGNNIDLAQDGTISVTFPEYHQYVLPTATANTLGGVRIGNNIDIDNYGRISVTFPEPPEPYVLPEATSNTLGGVKIQTSQGFKLENGVLAYSINKMNQNNPTGTGVMRMNASGDAGPYSVSLGKDNVAYGDYANSQGKDNNVTGNYGTAIGKSNTVSSTESTALGVENTVAAADSVAIGYNNDISSTFDYALGKGLELGYTGQIALGNYNDNLSNSLLEVGNGQDTNHRNNAFRIDNGGNVYILSNILFNKDNQGNYTNLTTYLGTQDTAISGLGTRVALLENNPYSLPIASSSVLGGIKVGDGLTINNAGVLSATAETFDPYDLEVYQTFSHNRRNGNEEIGFNSFASNGTSYGDFSTTFGYNSTAGKRTVTTEEVEDPETGEITEETTVTINGHYSFAEGYETAAEGNYSHSAGYGTLAGYENQFVIGKYNNNSSNNLFEVGNGLGPASRSNALAVDNSGNTVVSGTLSVNGININAGVVTLAYAVYNALSSDEKNKDIIYLITDTNELYYKTQIYGSLIEANPQGSPTDTLQTIKINNTVYDLNSVKFLTDEDLDDIFTDGYQVYHADDPSSITNLPTEVDGMFDLVSSGTEDNDEYTQYLYFKDTIYTRNATNNTWTEWAGISGGGSGNVEDVYVNGTSVLDENSIAQISSYKELTQAQYDALPDSKLTDGILYCITDAEPAASTVIAPVIYSLEEREIGTWIDGKPLYEKTIKTPIPNEAFNKEQYGYNHNIADIDACVYKKGFLFDSNTGTIQSNRVSVNNITSGNSTIDGTLCNTLFGFNRNKLTWTLGDWNGIFNYFVAVVRYTKTTDVPGSGEWTSTGVPAVHYLTDEQVIGTWIDGKPIYQKTITGTTTSSNSAQIYSISDNHIDYIIRVEGTLEWENQYGDKAKRGLGGYSNSNTYSDWGINSSNTYIVINYGEYHKNKPYIITLQYTKSTD